MYVWALHKCTDSFAENTLVGKFKANTFGVRDILGTVREWVEDSHHEGYGGLQMTDLPGKLLMNVRTGWFGERMDGGPTSTSAYRYCEKPSMKDTMTVFRVVRESFAID